MGNRRIEYAAKNFAVSTISNVMSAILNFISRTVFVYILGEVYLGINGLFTNIIGMLSLAEMGIGSAISFSLYKPLAENNTCKIQAVINFYKTAYRFVAVVVVLVGLALMPFLQYLLKSAEDVQNVYLIYAVFLFNTVSSYLISYKATILSANQKEYLLTAINLKIKAISIGGQIVLLIIFRSFLVYLLYDCAVQLIGKVYINHFVNCRYPYLKGKNTQRLSAEEKSTIFEKIRALIMHKIGDISINQTDNIITSAFISVTAVGLVSNYVMIIKMINMFVSSFFTSATAGFGNLIATESEERRYQIAMRYDYLGFVFYGWSAIVLYFCLTPFIEIWMGADRLIDGVTVALLCANYYLTGARVPLANVKMAAGVYEQDRWHPFVQSIINIVVSIIGAKYWGLKGIYIGTLISSMVPNILRPIIIYKYVFNKTSISYFKTYLIRICFLLGNVILVGALLSALSVDNVLLNFLLTMTTSAIIPVVLICLIYRKTEHFRYAIGLAYKFVGKLTDRKD